MSRPSKRLVAPYLDSVRRRRRAERLLEYVPEAAEGYREPLLDGGAVAVALLARHPQWSFVLGSPNRDLVTVWATVRAQAEELVERVAFHAARHSAPYFAAERDLAVSASVAGETVDAPATVDSAVASDVERAARFIYLRGTAAPDAGGIPRQVFGDAVFGRDTLAFDAAGVIELSAVLRDRDVELVLGAPFAVLPSVRDDDLVLVEMPAQSGRDAQKALRSFAGAVTAKGAALLLDVPAATAPDDLAAWRDLKRIDVAESGSAGPGAADPRGVESPVWGNRVLQRLRASEASAH